jgi:DnaK suppressor protein
MTTEHGPMMNTIEARLLLSSDLERLTAARELLDAQQTNVRSDVRARSAQDSSEVSEQIGVRLDALTELEAIDDEISDIRAALERVDQGTYGQCVTCGQQIEIERLRAMPSASRCIADQREFEAPTPRLGR